MRGYDIDEPENYDEYEDEEDQYEEEGEGEEYEEEEYEEEEERKPTKEELDYLELRQRLKESFRKNRKKEGGPTGSNSQERKKKLPYDNYGSFFGPSQPVIAQRVIQESKSFLENPNLALRFSSSQQGNKKTSVSTTTGSNNGVHKQPKVISAVKRKVETIKHARDYSFLLSDDTELPAPAKESAQQNMSARSSEARPAKVQIKSKPPSGNNGRNAYGDNYERKAPSSNGQMHPKSYKSSSANKLNRTSMDSRKQLGSNNAVGPGRPVGPKALPSKAPVATLVKKASAPGARDSLPGSHKPLPSSKVQSAVVKKHLEQKKGLQDPNKGKVMSKQLAAPMKPHVNKPIKPISSHVTHDHRPKKRPARRFSDDEDDPEKALSMIRKMFNTDRFAGRDDNDSDMEANFDDIMKEEKRSAKIARKEDEEQLRLIEEEERRERMRKKLKR
ncbi:histone H3.v1-like [Tripterygium wilfordii]|nr:histone H3.v1-like [Tripterygium wilfordii]